MKNKIIGLILGALCCWSVRAEAINLIRDTETEEVLLGYVQPIFQAAGLNPDNARVIIVNDETLNAFVAGGQTIFIHTGLILKADAPDELAFVLSHETGHIVGGHVVRGYQALEKARITALISTIIGGMAAVAGGRPDAGMAVMMGGQASAMNVFTQYRQTEESAADRTAVDIMKKTGYSMAGFENIMKKITAGEKLNTGGDDSYLRTHPLTRNRSQDLERFTQDTAPMRQEEHFDLIKAKLSGFLLPVKQVRRQYTGRATADRYAQTIAFYRDNQFPQAFDLLDGLIKEQPKNPYFHELKGQFLFETGKIKEAVGSYEEANRLKPGAPLIQLSYAQALLELGDTESLKRAEQLLTVVTQRTDGDPLGWQFLARIYGKQRKKEMADYAMAEYYQAIGSTVQAKNLARKLEGKFNDNPAIRQRILDIIDIPHEGM